ncbi:MAG: hypothetical protein EPN23_03300 [Verrucomicrobia bacterium]|nr:MAG: hypothetical protein EPN23_03300 [Verrucomicrobiota bacterium]
MTDKTPADSVDGVLQKIRDAYKKIGANADGGCGDSCSCGDDSPASGASCCSTPAEETSKGYGPDCHCKS